MDHRQRQIERQDALRRKSEPDASPTLRRAQQRAGKFAEVLPAECDHPNWNRIECEAAQHDHGYQDSQRAMELLAFLGDEGARGVLDWAPCLDPHDHTGPYIESPVFGRCLKHGDAWSLPAWLQGLATWGPNVLHRASNAAARVALPGWEERTPFLDGDLDDERPRRALDASERHASEGTEETWVAWSRASLALQPNDAGALPRVSREEGQGQAVTDIASRSLLRDHQQGNLDATRRLLRQTGEVVRQRCEGCPDRCASDCEHEVCTDCPACDGTGLTRWPQVAVSCAVGAGRAVLPGWEREDGVEWREGHYWVGDQLWNAQFHRLEGIRKALNAADKWARKPTDENLRAWQDVTIFPGGGPLWIPRPPGMNTMTQSFGAAVFSDHPGSIQAAARELCDDADCDYTGHAQATPARAQPQRPTLWRG